MAKGFFREVLWIFRYKDIKLRVNLELDKSYKEKQNYIFLEKDGNLYI